MSSQLPLFIVFILLTFISAQVPQNSISSDKDDFVNTVVGILENKQTLSEDYNTLSTFAYWKGSFWKSSTAFFDFSVENGLVAGYYKDSYSRSTNMEFVLQLYNGNHTDQDGLMFDLQFDLGNQFAEVNQANATIRYEYAGAWVSELPSGTSEITCDVDLYIYVVEKATLRPPRTFDTSNLHAYTKQFRIISAKCGFDIITSFFDNGYSVSLFDQGLFVCGCLVYTFASIYSRTNPQPNKRKVSASTLRWLMFFSYYTLAYIGKWLIEMNMFSDFLYLFIPFAIAMIVDLAKHSRDLFKNDGMCCCCLLILAPGPAVILVAIPEYGVYIGNLLTCIYMLPQVMMKYKERYERHRHITRFEIGNFICLSLWVLYLDLYPNNVFLTSQKPTLAFIYITVVLTQLSVLVYLEYGIPRKKLFKYTFAVNGSVDKEKLLEEQCAICLSEFEISAGDDKLYKTPCGHLFHPECLREWGGKKLECPCCRKKIPNFIYPID